MSIIEAGCRLLLLLHGYAGGDRAANANRMFDIIGEPAGTRTQDHLIKSEVLEDLQAISMRSIPLRVRARS
jgi:hypothetical protein